MEHNLIQSTAEMALNELRKWFTNGGGNGWELFFAPWFSVICLAVTRYPLEGFLQGKFIGLSAVIFKILIQSVYIILIAVVSNLLSVFIINWIVQHHFFLTQFSKWSEYEQVDGRFYLKREGKEQDFDNYLWIAMIVIAVVFKGIFSMDTNSRVFMNALEAVALWGELMWKYRDGETWRQAQRRNLEAGSQQLSPLSEMYELRNSTMKNSMCFFRRCLSERNDKPVKEMEFPKKYRAIYDNLKNDKSILIADIFYRDWERAFFIPLHRFLLHDRKAIILAGANIEEDELVRWVREEFKELIGIEKNWRVRSLYDEKDDWDILIVPYEKIPFFAGDIVKSTGCRSVFVLVLEPSRMMMEMRPYLEEMADRFRAMEDEPVYCFADQEFLGLLDGLSHVFRVKIEGIAIDWTQCPDFYSYGIDDTIKSDIKAPGNLLDYWGNDAVILKALLKKGTQAVLCSNGDIPILDKRDSVAGKILGSENGINEILKEQLENCIFMNSFWGMKREERWNVIVDDSQCNFFSLNNQLASRARKTEHVFVLSERYLLLPFLWANADKHMFSRNYIPSFVPIYCVSERNKLLKLIFSGWYHSITREQILAEFPELAEVEKPVKILEEKAKKFLDTDGCVFIKEGENAWDLDEEFCKRNAWWLEDIHLVDERLEQEVFGCRKLGHLYQKYLPEQYLTWHGRYYRILSIARTGTENRMVMQRSSSFVRQTSFYHQIRTYSVGKPVQQQLFSSLDFFELYKMEGEVRVTTEGCVEFVSNRDAWKREITDYNRREVRTSAPERVYKKKQWLWMKIASDMPEKERIYLGLAVLLTEISRTILPFHSPYLAVMPLKKTDQYCDVIYKLQAEVPDLKENGICIIEDSMEDMGLLDVFALHFLRIMDLCHQYGIWAVKDGENYYGSGEWMETLKLLTGVLDQFMGKAAADGAVGQDASAAAQQTAAAMTEDQDGPACTGSSDIKQMASPERRTRCTVCGRLIQDRSILGIPMYCEYCCGTRNRAEDYRESLARVTGWLNRNMKIYMDEVPKIRLRWFGGKWALLRPVIVRNRIICHEFLCKKFMDGDWMDLQMLYAYIELWQSLHKKKCRKQLGAYSRRNRYRLLPAWFQIQYLYLTNAPDIAEIMKTHMLSDGERGKELEQFISEYPILEKKTLADDDLQKLIVKNPIAEIMNGD